MKMVLLHLEKFLETALALAVQERNLSVATAPPKSFLTQYKAIFRRLLQVAVQ